MNKLKWKFIESTEPDLEDDIYELDKTGISIQVLDGFTYGGKTKYTVNRSINEDGEYLTKSFGVFSTLKKAKVFCQSINHLKERE